MEDISEGYSFSYNSFVKCIDAWCKSGKGSEFSTFLCYDSRLTTPCGNLCKDLPGTNNPPKYFEDGVYYKACISMNELRRLKSHLHRLKKYNLDFLFITIDFCEVDSFIHKSESEPFLTVGWDLSNDHSNFKIKMFGLMSLDECKKTVH